MCSNYPNGKRVLKGSSSLLSSLVVCWLCCSKVPSLDLSKLVVEEGAAKGAIVNKLKSLNMPFNKGLDVAKARASVVQFLLRDVVVGVEVVAAKVVQTGRRGEKVRVELAGRPKAWSLSNMNDGWVDVCFINAES